MRTIYVGADLKYEINSPTSLLLNLSVTANKYQNILHESTTITPYYELEYCQVGESGNRMQRLLAQPGELVIEYRATVDLHADTVDSTNVGESLYRDLPANVLTFLNPSRYCESDKLGCFAVEEFGSLAPSYSRVMAICDWTHAKIAYQPGSTGPSTTACDVLLQRVGVCRDFAHVAISLCRAIGIPARYVSGYAVHLQPPDFHGFFEAYLDGRWFLFDATRLAPVEGFVRIGTGRDAADVAFATLVGQAFLCSSAVWANDTDGTNSPGHQRSDDVGISSA